MEREIDILFIDDIWCVPEKQSIIRAEYGALQRQEIPYVFHYETAEAENKKYAVKPVIEHIKRIPNLGAAILDIMFGSKGNRLGLDILTEIRALYPILPVFMMTSIEGNVDVIERAMELGANEYLVKKPTLDELETALRIYTQPSISEADYAIWGNSPAIRRVRATIARVAASGSASVLVTGESGTGKELVARAIHRQGPRRRGLFIDKNCAHEKSDLLDSDLFGHEKGAFTGADRRHIGRIERANKGVLFLDEVGSMPPELQGKLLRVLETHQFQRLGGTDDVKSDFQLICATNENPDEMLKTGRLREDLYYRIRQIEIHVPPLREHLDDIPILIGLFVKRFKAGVGASYKAESFSDKATKKLKDYPWPGNIRELKNVAERIIILCHKSVIGHEDLPSEILYASQIGVDRLAMMNEPILPEDHTTWSRHLVLSQLKVLAEALERSRGNSTLAVKYLFPMVNSPNATYIKRFIKRLQEPPWGYSNPEDKEIKELTDRIMSYSRKGKKQ